MKKNNLFKLSLLAFSVLGVVGCSNVEPVTKEEQIIQENEDIVSHGVQVQRLSSGVDANDHPYQSFTYTATPSTVSASTVDVSATFVGGGSCENYLTVSHNASTRTITATCLQPFSTLIKIHIQSHYNVSAYADVTVHYTQKFNEGFKGTINTDDGFGMDGSFIDYLMSTWQSVGSLTTETQIDRSGLFDFTDQDLISHFNCSDEYDLMSNQYDIDIMYNNSPSSSFWDDDYRFMTFDYTWNSASDFSNQGAYEGLLWNVSKQINNEIAYILYDWFHGTADITDLVSDAIDNVLTKFGNFLLEDPFWDADFSGVTFEQFYNAVVSYFEHNCNPRTVTSGGSSLRYYTVEVDISEMVDYQTDTFGQITIYNDTYEYITANRTVQRDSDESVVLDLDLSLVQANLVCSYTYIFPISHYGYTSLSSQNNDLYF